jgi:hypothetical protein
MSTLEFIDQQIEKHNKSIDTFYYDLRIVEKSKERIKQLQQVRKELEIVELIKNNCTGIKYNSNKGSAIKLDNINALDFIKLFNRLSEIVEALKDEA